MSPGRSSIIVDDSDSSRAETEEASWLGGETSFC